MHVRLTFLSTLPEYADEVTKTYNEEVVPVVKKQKGNIDIFLLASTDNPLETISFSSWESKEKADEYEASGLYNELVGKVKHTFAKPPVLKTYNT